MLLLCFKTHYGAKVKAAGYQDHIFVSSPVGGRMPFCISLALWSDHYSSANSCSSYFSFNESQIACTPSLWACSHYSGYITLLTAPAFSSSPKPEIFCNVSGCSQPDSSSYSQQNVTAQHFLVLSSISSANCYRNPFSVNRSYKWPGSFCFLSSSCSRRGSKDNYSCINSLSCHQNYCTGILQSPS